ncbi:MAG: sensor domain-containing diguanylate cyclase [Spirochaetes bacterium]|nr:sensor domain-containing diguanylate cyclase [Spirochaetota bacterium]
MNHKFDSRQSSEDLEKKIFDLRNLIEIGMSLSSTLEFENLVESILYSIIGQMFVERVAIILQVDIDVNNFYVHMCKGYDECFDKNTIIVQENSPLVRFFESDGKPRKIAELVQNPIFLAELDKFQPLDPEIFVPMVSKEKINGLLILGRKIHGTEFTESDLDFLKDLARFAAIAVENSRLYRMATVDRKTRLYVHHFFLERLDEEIKRCQRYEQPLSVIMCDIDHFKQFNDTYGHQQGDVILKEIGALIRKNIRKMDIASRFGGEEFSIALPETKLNGAHAVASRIRKQVEAYPFSGLKDPLHVTISLGVAEYDKARDKSPEDLLKRADTALYKAKNSGRNRVAMFK